MECVGQPGFAACGSPEEILARAERMVAALQGEFATDAHIRIRRIADICDRLWATPASREQAIGELRRLAHDLKGEAGTFGYHLVTEIAGLFGDYLRETPAALQRPQAIASYVGALQAVWTLQIEGDGGATGRALLDRLILRNQEHAG